MFVVKMRRKNSNTDCYVKGTFEKSIREIKEKALVGVLATLKCLMIKLNKL